MAAQWVDRYTRRGGFRRFLRRLGITFFGGAFAFAVLAPPGLAASAGAAGALPSQLQHRAPYTSHEHGPLTATRSYPEPALIRQAAARPRLEPARANLAETTSLARTRTRSSRGLSISRIRVVADASAFRTLGHPSPPPAQPARAKGEDPRYVLPVADEHVTDELLTKPHHDYAAWDLALAEGTEVASVTAGHVTGVTSGARCGLGVQVVGIDGFTYVYCHGSETIARIGDEVEAGDLIMLSGNTGASTGPHLHLQMRNPAGALVCPQDLLPSWADGKDALPAEAGETGCFYRSAGHGGEGEDGEDEGEGDKAKKVAAAPSNKKKKGNKKSKGHNSAPPKPTAPGPKPEPKPDSTPKTEPSPAAPTPAPAPPTPPPAAPTPEPSGGPPLDPEAAAGPEEPASTDVTP